MFLIMDSGISLSLKSKQIIITTVQLMNDGYAVTYCITYMIIMSDILKFQKKDAKRKPEKIILCPTFQAIFMVCTTLNKQNSRTFQGQITIFND